MKHLQAVTAVYAGGRWLRPGDPLPGDLPDFDYEKAARKGHIEDTEGGEIENPPLLGQAVEETSELDLDELFSVREELWQEREARAADQRRAEDRYAGLSGELASVRTEAQKADVAHAQALEQAKAEHETALAALREEHARALEEAKASGLPEDAHARLVALPKIGDTLADQILAALKAPATPAPEPRG